MTDTTDRPDGHHRDLSGNLDDLAVILAGPPWEVAPRLLGCELIRDIETHDGPVKLSGRIVETEAYDQTDAASHSYKGRTPRTDVMFGPPGFLYVYFTYGMHYCCNIVTGPEDHGSAVLIRALEPLAGADVMSHNRRGISGPGMTNGPAKSCQALAIGHALNGHDLRQAPLRLAVRPPLPQDDIVQTTRIGISQAQDMPWRFYERGNKFVSRS